MCASFFVVVVEHLAESEHFVLENVELFARYKLRVDYVTPFGRVGSSNLVSYMPSEHIFIYVSKNIKICNEHFNRIES